MRLHVLLAWYDEPEDWLRELVASCAPVADTIVAVDGAYELYEQGAATSPPEQREAIERAAKEHGLECRVYEPERTWRGDQVEKRAFMFGYALQGATPYRDWYLIMDADEVVERVDAALLRSRLASTDRDVAEVGFSRVKNCDMPYAFRSLFRALPTLTVEGAHYNYVAERGGRKVHLWHVSHRTTGARPEPAEYMMECMTIRHRLEKRPAGRELKRQRYYQVRDELGIERSAYEEGLRRQRIKVEQLERMRRKELERLHPGTVRLFLVIRSAEATEIVKAQAFTTEAVCLTDRPLDRWRPEGTHAVAVTMPAWVAHKCRLRGGEHPAYCFAELMEYVVLTDAGPLPAQD